MWLQNLSKEIEQIALAAVAIAKENPTQWFAPLTPELGSCVRFVPTTPECFEVYQTYRYRAELNDPIYPPKEGGLSSYSNITATIAGLKEAWYNEVSDYGASAVAYQNLYHLIKHMGSVGTEKLEIVKSHRCLLELSSILRFKTLISAERRFPLRISYPQELYFAGINGNDEANFSANWALPSVNTALLITCRNLGMLVHRGSSKNTANLRLVLRGKKTISQFMLEDFVTHDAWALEQKMRHYRRKPSLENTIIGEGSEQRNGMRLVWRTPSGEYGGEWVFFMHARSDEQWPWPTYTKQRFTPEAQLPTLWTIHNSGVDDAYLNEPIFEKVLSSFELLPPEAFRSHLD
jgi:hypothetical protein